MHYDFAVSDMTAYLTLPVCVMQENINGTCFFSVSCDHLLLLFAFSYINLYDNIFVL